MARTWTRHILGIVLPISTVLLLLGGGLIQHYLVLGFEKPIEEPRLEWALLLTIGALLSLLPRRVQPWGCMAILLCHQSLAWFDANYYRFFRDYPSLHLLPTWAQAANVGDSTLQGMQRTDLLLTLPVLGFLPLAFLAKRWQPEEERKLLPSLILVVLAAAGWGVALHTIHPVRYTQLQRRFQNKALVKIFGPQFYHYYDLYEWLRVSLQLADSRPLDAELVKKIVGESRASSTADTPYRGMYQGRDLLFLQLESLQHFAVDAEYEGKPIMPFLHKASTRVHSFRLFDQTHLGRSADGQFIYLNSLHPPASRPLPFVFPNNFFYSIPRMFVEKGYSTYYFHPGDPTFWNAGTISAAYGFQHRLFRKSLPARDRDKDIRGWGLTDRALYEHVVERLSESKEPYFAYVVTLMCHHPYSAASNEPVDFPPAKPANQVRRYLRCAAARDKALENFVRLLSQTERGRKTVICLAGDHDANLKTSEMKKLGYPIYPESESVPMMIGSVEEFLGSVDARPLPAEARSGGQIDVAPTLGHVFSLNMEESVFVGWNLFATQNRGPYQSRVGTWMDQTGRIRLKENGQASGDTSRFEVSEMLLGADKIRDFKRKF